MPYAIRGLASLDAIVNANNTLQIGLKLEQAGIKIPDAVNLMTRLAHVELAKLILDKSSLPKSIGDKIIDRLISQHFAVTANNQALPIPFMDNSHGQEGPKTRKTG